MVSELTLSDARDARESRGHGCLIHGPCNTGHVICYTQQICNENHKQVPCKILEIKQRARRLTHEPCFMSSALYSTQHIPSKQTRNCPCKLQQINTLPGDGYTDQNHIIFSSTHVCAKNATTKMKVYVWRE